MSHLMTENIDNIPQWWAHYDPIDAITLLPGEWERALAAAFDPTRLVDIDLYATTAFASPFSNAELSAFDPLDDSDSSLRRPLPDVEDETRTLPEGFYDDDFEEYE